MNTKASRQLAQLLARLDRRRRKRQALMHQVVQCLWWLDIRSNAPNSGGDAA